MQKLETVLNCERKLYLHSFILSVAFFNSLIAAFISRRAELFRTDETNGRVIGRDSGECCLIFSRYE